MRVETLLLKYRGELALKGQDLSVREIDSYVKGANDILKLVTAVFNVTEAEFFAKTIGKNCTSTI